MSVAVKHPVCNKSVQTVAKNHTLKNVVNAYLRMYPEKRRDAADLAELDARNKITDVGGSSLLSLSSQQLTDDDDTVILDDDDDTVTLDDDDDNIIVVVDDDNDDIVNDDIIVIADDDNVIVNDGNDEVIFIVDDDNDDIIVIVDWMNEWKKKNDYKGTVWINQKESWIPSLNSLYRMNILDYMKILRHVITDQITLCEHVASGD